MLLSKTIFLLHKVFKQFYNKFFMIEVIKIKTKGGDDFINITEKIEDILKKSKKKEGIVNIFARHTTAGLAIIEDEKGIVQDFKSILGKIAPINSDYNHNKIQNDDNGHSHVKGSILGASVCVPFLDGELLLGTWQQIFLVDFDTHGREREVVVSVN